MASPSKAAYSERKCPKSTFILTVNRSVYPPIQGKENRLSHRPIHSATGTDGLDFLIAHALMVLCHSLFKVVIEKVIQGTYDKKGLPDDWAEFMESVFDFMTFYGWGEIMNPAVYGKVRRCGNDIIYCSVTFDEGYKSYYYIADDDSIEVGDYVIVPAGKDNHEATVEVVKKEYYAADEVPLPMEKTKHIIRKCTKDDFDLPKE